MKDIKTTSNEKDVIIKGNATVGRGITCVECVENKHSECSLSDYLCAKRIMLLTDKNTMFCSEIYIYNYVFSIL